MPARALFEQAIAGTGWTLAGKVNYTAQAVGTTTISLSGGGTAYYTVSQQTADLTFTAASAALLKRYVQWVDDLSFIKVWCQASVNAIGESANSQSGSVAVTFDASAWESNSAMLPAVATPVNGENWVDYGGAATGPVDAGIAGAALARSVLIAKAKAAIQASHRRNFLSFEIDLEPTLDLTHTVAITTPLASAQAKVRSFADRWDFTAGRFTSSVQLALSEIYGAGVAPLPVEPPPTSSPTPPAGPFSITAGTWVGGSISTPAGAVPADAWGFFTNVNNRGSSDYSGSATRYPLQFTIRTPAIENASRDNLKLVVPIVLDAGVHQDFLTITA